MSLGKGLGALISTSSSRNKKGSKAGKEDKIWYIPISSIQPDPNQPRKEFDAKQLDELAASIKQHGVLQPILLSEKTDGGYEIISGERRWRAAKIAGLVTIPAIIKKIADQQKVEISLVENIQREDLNVLEEAFAYQRLADEYKMSHQEIADKLGKSRPAVSNFIRILYLPEEAKKALIEKKITYAQGRALLSLPTEEEQLEMLAQVLSDKMSTADIERAVSRKTMHVKKAARKRDPNIVYLEDQLREKLDTKVAITEQSGKGKLIIEYYSKDELSKLVKSLL